MTKSQDESMLKKLTSIPTASGREDRVIEWIERWVSRQRNVQIKRDQYGNLLLERQSARGRQPVVFAAHMDHPAFVVTGIRDSHCLEAEFRGGVAKHYFVGSGVAVYHGRRRAQYGEISSVREGTMPGVRFKVLARFTKEVHAEPGDVMTWNIRPARIKSGRLYAPACDDLAGVAASLAAFSRLVGIPSQAADVRVLLTRAEEIGFVGAIAACKGGIIPKKSQLIVIENSKSYNDSPIGGGPIVRVGDYTSTFDPDLTYRVGKVAQAIAKADPKFKWQRKLMSGGTCEASAYQALGYAVTCVCLPLGRYHNMNEQCQVQKQSKIDAEVIGLSDFHGLIRLLFDLGKSFGHNRRRVSLRPVLTDLFAKRQWVIE